MRNILIFALVSLLIVGFIWGNSLKSIKQSADQSAPVAEAVRPVLDPKEKMEKSDFHDLVRKLAHVTEFFALGLSVAGFTLSLGAYLQKRLISMPILIVLSVAVTDEFIQNFTGRGSMVTDVVLDFSGAVAGLLAAWLLYYCVSRIIKSKEHTK